MKRETLIESLVEAASTLYGSGVPLKEAVSSALNQYQSRYDRFQRFVLYREICRQLGRRGSAKAHANAATEKHQLSFTFTPSKKA